MNCGRYRLSQEMERPHHRYDYRDDYWCNSNYVIYNYLAIMCHVNVFVTSIDTSYRNVILYSNKQLEFYATMPIPYDYDSHYERTLLT